MKKTIALMLVLASLVLLVSCRAATPKDDSKLGADSTVPPVVAGTGSAVETTGNTELTDGAASDETTAAETTEAAASDMDEGKAVSIARDYLGETDPDTGYSYSYQFETITSEGNYKIKVSWYIEEDERFSTCGYLIVTPDGEVSKFDW